MKKDLLLASIEEVEKELYSLRIEKANLFTDIDIISKELESKRLSNNTLENINNELQSKNNILSSRNKSIGDTILFNQDKLSILENSIISKDKQISINNDIINNIESKISNSKQQEVQYNKSIIQLNNNITKKEFEYTNLISNINIEKQKLAIMQNNILSIEDFIEDLNKKENDLKIKQSRLLITEKRLNNLKKELFLKK